MDDFRTYELVTRRDLESQSNTNTSTRTHSIWWNVLIDIPLLLVASSFPTMDPKASNAIVNFAVKFCNELQKQKTTICSPLSAEIVLALLALGCRNKSRAELLKALDFPDDEAIRSTFSFLTSTLRLVQGATLNVANKVYLMKGGCLQPGIEKDAVEVFDSSLEQLDFSKKEASADIINEWVARKTNDKIRDIVSPDIFDEDTGLVLVNAIYFQGTWEIPFPEYCTHDRDFHVNKATTIKVPQMYLDEERFNYGASTELKAKFLEMKYKGSDTSMVIVLPDEIEGLSEVMQKLAAGHDLMADLQTLRKIELETVLIPKFKAEMTIDLKEILSKLGIESIFDTNAAEINMLVTNQKQYVSEAVQKAFIDVNEVGTEAAACTRFPIQLMCARFGPRISFKADRPFLYLLLARKIPLFIGIYEGREYDSKLGVANQDPEFRKYRDSRPDARPENIGIDLRKTGSSDIFGNKNK